MLLVARHVPASPARAPRACDANGLMPARAAVPGPCRARALLGEAVKFGGRRAFGRGVFGVAEHAPRVVRRMGVYSGERAYFGRDIVGRAEHAALLERIFHLPTGALVSEYHRALEYPSTIVR